MIDGLKKDRPAFLANVSKTFFGAGVFHSPASTALMTWTVNLAMLASPKAATDCVTAFGTTGFHLDMAHFKVPALGIHSDAGQAVPVDVTGKAATAAIPGATFAAYEGTPHAVPFTHADRLTIADTAVRRGAAGAAGRDRLAGQSRSSSRSDERTAGGATGAGSLGRGVRAARPSLARRNHPR